MCCKYGGGQAFSSIRAHWRNGRSQDEQRSTGGFWVFFHLGSWVLGSKESWQVSIEFYMSYFQPPPEVNSTEFKSCPLVILMILSECLVQLKFINRKSLFCQCFLWFVCLVKVLVSSPCRSLGWLLQVPAAAAAAAPLGAPAAEGCDAPGTCSPATETRVQFSGGVDF